MFIYGIKDKKSGEVVAFAKEFNLNSKVITQVLRKEKKAHQGLIFEYKEN